MAKLTSPKKMTDLPKPYHTNAMAEVARQTDRGAAIVGGAYLDLVLREAITARFCDIPDILDKLFENRGPLQDFGARIWIGIALGLYGGAAYEDLCIIKDVRNSFAHSAEAIDFDRADVASLCHHLWFPKKIPYSNQPTPTTAKELFIRAIELLSDGLHENVNRQRNGMPPSNFLMMGPKKPSKTPA